MQHELVVAIGIAGCFAAQIGCDQAAAEGEHRSQSEVSPAGAEGPGAPAVTAEAKAAAPRAAEAEAPACLVGTWDAREFVSRARGAFRGALGNSGLATAGGTITFEFAPPVDGKGTVTARAL